MERENRNLNQYSISESIITNRRKAQNKIVEQDCLKGLPWDGKIGHIDNKILHYF